MSKNLITRIVVALIFGPLIINISYVGGYWLLGLILLLSIIGMIEYLSAGKIRYDSILFWISLTTVVSMIVLSAYELHEFGLLAFVGCFVLIGIVCAIKNEAPADLYRRQAELIWGVAYLGLLYPFVYRVRLLADNGGDWLLFLFGTLWLSDTLAMFAGKAFGKRKLAPTVSPNKTVAGFIGGLGGGIVVALILKWWRLPEVPLLELFGAGIIVSLIGQLGDLAESCWKRAVGIKDSSAIIPGHGGVLDRFDSLLFAAPAFYIYLRYFILYQSGG